MLGGGPKIKVDQNGMKHGLILEFLRSMKFSKWGGGQKIKVAQNGMKHGLILEFLRSDEILVRKVNGATSKAAYIRTP